MKKLTVIIPVFNHWKCTAKCLASITKFGLSKSQQEIIVINNASTDETSSFLSFMQKENDSIKVVNNEKNLDFLLAANQGWKMVETPYILLLNNDAYVKESCVQRLVEILDKEQTVGISSGVDVKDDGSNMFPPLWYFCRENNNIGNSIRTEILDENAPFIEVDIGQLACSVIKREVWEKVGFFDEQYAPCFYEDFDYSALTKEAGYKVVVVPKAKYIHYLGTTTVRDPTYYNRIMNRNRELFRVKWGEKLRTRKI